MFTFLANLPVKYNKPGLHTSILSSFVVASHLRFEVTAGSVVLGKIDGMASSFKCL